MLNKKINPKEDMDKILKVLNLNDKEGFEMYLLFHLIANKFDSLNSKIEEKDQIIKRLIEEQK